MSFHNDIRCKNEMDMNVAIPAYYNFVGHQVSFRNSDVDLLLRKSIECKCPHLTHDVFSNLFAQIYLQS